MSREKFEQHRAQVKALYEKLYAELYEVKLALAENPRQHDLPELVDMGWSMKCCESLLKELQTRYAEVREKTLQSIICVRYIDETVNEIEAIPIHGKLATGTPFIGEMHKTPKPNTPEGKALMNELGVPPGNESIFRVHWPTLVELVTERKSKGLPIPKVLADAEATYPVYNVRYRVAKNKPKETKNA